MADRTVNVNIKYNLNTAEVQKATAATLAAQKATEELRKSVEKFGKESVKANRDAAKATQDLTKQFGDLYSSVKLVLTGGIAKEIIDITLNMAKLSGQIEGVSRAFARLPNATLLLDDLQKSTHGTVTNLELMQKALQAQNFRIPLQNLGKLFEFAAAKAQQTGQEVNHLIDYIVSGIGYRSIKRLDDLGFTANRVKEALGGVSLQAASMQQVMSAVTTLMNEDLQKTGGYAVTTATEVEQIETKWAKLKTTVSGILTSPAVIKFYQNTLDLLNSGADALAGKDLQNQANAQALKEVKLIKERLLTAEILKDKQKTFDVIQQEANSLQQNIGRNNDELKNARERLDLLYKLNTGEATRNDLYGDRFNLEGKTLNQRAKTNVEFAKTVEAEKKELETQVDFYNFKNMILSESIKILGEYNKSLDVGTDESEDQLSIVKALRAELEAINDAIEETNSRGDLGASGALIKRRDALQKTLDDLLGKSKDSTKKTANAVQEYLSNLSDLELFNMNKMLADRNEARKKEAENEKENAQRSAELQEYFLKLRARKYQEAEDEAIQIAEDAAAQRIRIQQEITDATFNTFGNFISAELMRESDAYSERIDRLRDFYDEQLLLAGDNEGAKKKLRLQEEREIQDLEKKRADREKKSVLGGIVANTALAIVKIFAGEGTYVDKLIRAGIMTAEGASQYAAASRARYYAKGEINIKGPGSETSDSIPAMLSKGESIMTAKQTREAFGILTEVRNGKLNDRVLKQIVNNGGSQVQLSDERIVNELKGIRKSQYSLERQYGNLYRVYRDSEGNVRRNRVSIFYKNE